MSSTQPGTPDKSVVLQHTCYESPQDGWMCTDNHCPTYGERNRRLQREYEAVKAAAIAEGRWPRGY